VGFKHRGWFLCQWRRDKAFQWGINRWLLRRSAFFGHDVTPICGKLTAYPVPTTISA
jgi:hypothetical protein